MLPVHVHETMPLADTPVLECRIYAIAPADKVAAFRSSPARNAGAPPLSSNPRKSDRCTATWLIVPLSRTSTASIPALLDRADEGGYPTGRGGRARSSAQSSITPTAKGMFPDWQCSCAYSSFVKMRSVTERAADSSRACSKACSSGT